MRAMRRSDEIEYNKRKKIVKKREKEMERERENHYISQSKNSIRFKCGMALYIDVNS